MNPKVDSFLSKAERWQKEMEALRAISLDCGLTEELKWGKPCYVFEKSNIAIIQPFKEYCALLFFKGALLNDPDGILVQLTENTQSARQARFTKTSEITQLSDTLKQYLFEAVEVEKAGLEVDFKKTEDYDVPEELQQKLDEDAEFKAAFEALTPGRQRGYLLYFAGAKQSQTRTSRIEKCRDKIFAGKGYNER